MGARNVDGIARISRKGKEILVSTGPVSECCLTVLVYLRIV